MNVVKSHIGLILVILFCFDLNSQNNLNGTVEYGMVYNNSLEVNKPNVSNSVLEYIQNDIKLFEENSKSLNFSLEFNSQRAQFQVKNLRDILSNDDLSLVLLASNSKGLWYSDLNDNLILRQATIFNEKLLIRNDFDHLKWNIIRNEQKNIKNFKCYKATTEIVLDNGEKYIIEAFFTPELPIPIGPKDFVGLPGLILELREKHFTFYAKSIQISDKDIVIIKPTDGFLIEIDDLKKRIVSSMDNKWPKRSSRN